MTIAATRTRELDIAKICQRAHQLIGVANESQGISADKLSLAKDFLEMILDDLEADGLRARAVAFETLALVEGQSAYSLNADAIDVFGPVMYIPPGTVDLDHASGEIPLVAISREDWQLQPAKDATGRPIQYFSNRSAVPVEIRVWPTPTASDLGTLRMQVHRLAADSSDASKTLDVERYWVLHVTYKLGSMLASAGSLNPGRVMYFEQIADKHLEKCKSYSAQKTPSRFVVAHRTGWNR